MKYKVTSLPAYDALIEEYKPTPEATFGILLYGYSGAGKTILASTFPDPFFVDADRGMRSLSSEFTRIQLQSTETPFTFILSILQDALAHRGPWAEGGRLANKKTIVIDSVTALIDDYLAVEAMNESHRNVLTEKLSYDEYGKIQSRMTALNSVIKDLSHEYYVVMTALVEEEKDEVSGTLVGKPKLTGKYRDKIMADFDEVYYLACEPQIQGPPKYIAYPRGVKWYRGKTRLLKPEVRFIESPTFEKIMANRK